MKSERKHNRQASCVGMCSVIVNSPIGDIEISSCKQGLHLIKQCAEDDSNFYPYESCPVEVKRVIGDEITMVGNESIEWLKDYFHKKIAKQDVPKLCPTIFTEGTFTAKAWDLLPAAVPYGQTITYSQLASLCGNAKASRAAGMAMSSNPISFLIPCHRVIPSNGGVGNYSQGRKNSIKSWLLDFEQSQEIKERCVP